MRTFKVFVNGSEYEVAIEEINSGSAPSQPQPSVASAAPAAPRPAPSAAAPQPAQPATPQSPTSSPVSKGDSITAPIPGTVIDVKVAVGDSVTRGTTVVILEAMKMENEIQATSDGTVTAVEVEKGASVNAGAVLVVIG